MTKEQDDNRFTDNEKQAIAWLEACLDDPDPTAAIVLAFKSANLLPPDNLIRAAAVDKMLGLAKTSQEHKEQVLALLKHLINKDSDHNTYSVTVYNYYTKETAATTDPHDRFNLAHDIVSKPLTAPPGMREKLLSIWKPAIKELVKVGEEHYAMIRMAWVLAGPEMPKDLAAEMAEIWPWLIKRSNHVLALEETLSASKSIYKTYPSIDECVTEKEIIARTLCNLASKIMSPGLLQKVIMQAARYEGDNEDLQRQITDRLEKLAKSGGTESNRTEAQQRLEERAARLTQPQSANPSQPKPKQGSLKNKFHDELTPAMDPSLSIEKQLELTLKAACALDPNSLKGEAAIDRLMDLAAGQISKGEPGLYYLQQATALAAPASLLAEKGLRLIDQELYGSDDTTMRVDTTTFLLWNVKDLPAKKSDMYIDIWQNSIKETISRNDDPNTAFKWVVNVLADARSSEDLTQYAIPLWYYSLDKIKEQTDDLTAFGLIIAMNSRLYNSKVLKHDDCTEIKALLAQTLLDCAVDPKLEGMGEIASLAASNYDGDNLIIRQALYDRMESIIESGADKEIKNKAEIQLKRHGDFLKEHASDDQSPPLPPPAP